MHARSGHRHERSPPDCGFHSGVGGAVLDPRGRSYCSGSVADLVYLPVRNGLRKYVRGISRASLLLGLVLVDTEAAQALGVDHAHDPAPLPEHDGSHLALQLELFHSCVEKYLFAFDDVVECGKVKRQLTKS